MTTIASSVYSLPRYVHSAINYADSCIGYAIAYYYIDLHTSVFAAQYGPTVSIRTVWTWERLDNYIRLPNARWFTDEIVFARTAKMCFFSTCITHFANWLSAHLRSPYISPPTSNRLLTRLLSFTQSHRSFTYHVILFPLPALIWRTFQIQSRVLQVHSNVTNQRSSQLHLKLLNRHFDALQV